jgi:hypothetical protein
MNNKICYVCNKPIKECFEKAPRKILFHRSSDVRLYHVTSPIYVGNDMYRHARCEPGSTRWMQSKVSRKSKLRAYFKLGGNNEV